ncbi:unnamed protein product [Adineta steineri]|uniref:BZIP domain-containing protein n=1 Tax=Adineta steineri TaxID=433720 RepID=A0A813YF94_9BILA|nr:unnamed protein product [Adineta steineri]CAF3505858.1 unnamed protein product [Adineta steineri]
MGVVGSLPSPPHRPPSPMHPVLPSVKYPSSPSPVYSVLPSLKRPSSPSPVNPVLPPLKYPTSPSPVHPVLPPLKCPTSPSPVYSVLPSVKCPSSPSPVNPVLSSVKYPSSPSPIYSVLPSVKCPSSPSPVNPVLPSLKYPTSPSPVNPTSPSPSLPTLDNPIKIIHAESVSSSDSCTCSNMITDKMDCISNSSSKSQSDGVRKYERRQTSASPLTVMYGPINIKVRQSTAPTLATGRRSKFYTLVGDEAVKREIRRKRNREAAQKLKEKRSIIEDDLNKQILEYETKEKELLLKIEGLKTYKLYLETQCRELACKREKFVRSAFQTVEHNREQVHQNVPIHHRKMHTKDEPRSPSPQWQLLFSI